ncbi:hypothetical protein V475_02125 [Sphingobium baderi LL03]|uniref:Uncharacterized protein n=1 Tax=Sphingobium baderi LL03 TaxID=1114964 RepID=T0HF53_9SPHN|nr:hypothetical protein L485_20000 [Sphingobium baderi LL03]KMS63610.1 hypothetical protein V475_02125 [Sphingobium baderi LL03]
MLNLIFFLGVVGVYSVFLACTRRPRLGWVISAAIAVALMTALILMGYAH